MKMRLIAALAVCVTFTPFAHAQFMQPYSGAVARTENSKLSDFATAADFGVSTSGDQTTKLDSALAARSHIFGIGGPYPIQTPLTIPAGKTLELLSGSSLAFSGSGSLSLGALSGFISKKYGLAGNAWIWAQSATGTLSSSGADPFSVNLYSYPFFAFSIPADDAVVPGDGFLTAGQFSIKFGGSATRGGREAISGIVDHANGATSASNTNRNYAGTHGGALVRNSDGGSDTSTGAKGAYFGLSGVCQAFAGATNLLECAGAEINTFSAIGSSARYIIGNSVVGYNAVRGSEVDAAYEIGGGSASGDFGPHIGWDYGLVFTDIHGTSPVHSGSTLIGGYFPTLGTQSITHGVDLSNFDISGSIIRGQSTTLTEDTLQLGNNGSNQSIVVSNGTATNSDILITAKGTGTAALVNGAGNQVLQGKSDGTVVAPFGALKSGQNTSVSGEVGIANGGVGGATASIKNPSATVAYNFNLPATAGTSGYLLTSGGGGSAPNTWTAPVAIGGLVLIETKTASASATVDFTTGLNDTYDSFVLVVTNAKPATDDVQAVLQIGTGATPTWQSSGYEYGLTGVNRGGAAATLSASASGFVAMSIAGGSGDGVGNASGEQFSATIEFSNPEAGDYVPFDIRTRYNRATDGTLNRYQGGGQYSTVGAITGLRFKFSSGNVASGRFTLYGLRKS